MCFMPKLQNEVSANNCYLKVTLKQFSQCAYTVVLTLILCVPVAIIQYEIESHKVFSQSSVLIMKTRKQLCMVTCSTIA